MLDLLILLLAQPKKKNIVHIGCNKVAPQFSLTRLSRPGVLPYRESSLVLETISRTLAVVPVFPGRSSSVFPSILVVVRQRVWQFCK